jgi:hypothetical protein
MKIITNILIILGVLLLIIAGLGKFLGRPHLAQGVRLISLIILANTAFLIAILIKLTEKK